jgi:hypothetical protein
MKIEGERGKRFRAYSLDSDGRPLECVFECDELSELTGFKPRADQRYKWRVDGCYMTPTEFIEALKARQR